MNMFENIDAFLGDDLAPVVQRSKIDNRGNHISPVCCEHPTILFNPNWYDVFMKYGEMHYKSTIYRYSNYCEMSIDDFRRKIFIDIHPNLDNYSKLIVPRKGREDFNVLMAVPCGKCDFCRANKSAEYAFRSSCETSTYPECPLFITITYKDKYLPEQGLDITHFQKFMKRLRFHLSEQKETKDEKINLRYLAVGEYGSKFGRPHYHVILWNYPVSCFKDKVGNINYNRMYSSIYKSWLSYVLDDAGHRQYVYGKYGKRLPKMESMGIIRILPVEAGCTNYITKYFRKEPHNKLGYKGKTFLCSSRKNGGIGAEYIRSQRDMIYRCRFSSDLKISVQDPTSQKVFSRGITNYIKYLLFPSKSVLYNKKKNHYEIISKISAKYEAMIAAVLFYRDKFNPHFFINDKGKKLISFLRDFITFKPSKYYRNNFSFYKKWHHLDLIREIKEKIAEIDLLYSFLDLDFVKSCRTAIYERQQFMLARERCRTSVTYNLEGQRDKYDYNYSKYIVKCTF